MKKITIEAFEQINYNMYIVVVVLLVCSILFSGLHKYNLQLAP